MAAVGQICTAALTRLLLRRPLTRGQVVGVSGCCVSRVPATARFSERRLYL
jgi:hypothetical protein